VLVTAQLIDPLTNVHLWSESYNREFSDIFAIQADIATKIAGALEAQFSLAEQESIERQPTESMQAYAFYLKGLQRAFPRLERLDDMNNAISIDPEFGLAYALRAYIRAGTVRFSQTETEFLELGRSIREDAQRALSLDSAATMAYVAVARLDEALWRGASARTSYQRALEIKPNDPEVLIHYASLLRNLGALDEALAMARRASWLDPASQLPTHLMGHIYFVLQDFDSALSAYEIVRATPPTNSGASILMAYIAAIQDKPEDARRHLQFAEEVTRPALWAFQVPRIALGYARAGYADEAQRMFAEVERLNEESPLGDAAWAIAYIAVNDYERALVRLNSAIDTRRPIDFVVLAEIKTNLFQDPILDTDPRFLEARSKLVFSE
jgi:tetratricopeptide (TPR) repeat protein